MSENVAAEPCVALGGTGRAPEAYPGRDLRLGDLQVTRVLPVRGRRLVGPWCFLDRFGPLAFASGKPMDVGPHPHIGLQTVTWLLDGEVLHDDSLGFESVARAGGVNVMTAGAGIAHAEQTPARHSNLLSGVQLWVALPDAVRNGPPGFQHVAEVPVAELRGGIVRPFAGSLGGATSPASYHSPIAGAQIDVWPEATVDMDADRSFEHAALLLEGDASADNTQLAPHVLYYFGRGRGELAFRSRAGAKILLVGGLPFGETILMWWNFVARTPGEIAAARADWEQGHRFGPVRGYAGPPIPAPPLARLASPNTIS
ncbi:MAG: pirin family protein [Vicinamibacterales bacterium]